MMMVTNGKSYHASVVYKRPDHGPLAGDQDHVRAQRAVHVIKHSLYIVKVYLYK